MRFRRKSSVPLSPPPPRNRPRCVALLSFIVLTGTALADYPGAPASVTAAYLEADGAGLALDGETVPKLLLYTTWKETPGWDSFTVIKSYDIGEVGWDKDHAKNGDTAFVQIIYHILGHVDGSKFTSKPADEAVSFDLVKKAGRWKIVKPQLPPHLGVEATVSILKARGEEAKPALRQLQSLE